MLFIIPYLDRPDKRGAAWAANLNVHHEQIECCVSLDSFYIGIRCYFQTHFVLEKAPGIVMKEKVLSSLSVALTKFVFMLLI